MLLFLFLFCLPFSLFGMFKPESNEERLCSRNKTTEVIVEKIVYTEKATTCYLHKKAINESVCFVITYIFYDNKKAPLDSIALSDDSKTLTIRRTNMEVIFTLSPKSYQAMRNKKRDKKLFDFKWGVVKNIEENLLLSI